ncbi:hypothetical protein [Butyrivibrio sp.]|uniref:hypothetical protein n=1 Tax=Butyrivibrio sp. TaxID=28121 RepID=UPI0025C04B20|nr:hypothetical protein [Butyrivibrio sp.]MBE5838881.1 hypothetical protein [Butyrivibrio sp.]
MKHNDRVAIKGTVSRKTAEAMKRGEIESNNGLRKASGRRSWNPEQPEFELDETPSWAQELKNEIRRTVTDVAIEELDYTLRNRVFPAMEDLFYDKVVPFLFHKWENRSAVSEAGVKEVKQPIEENMDNIIQFSDCRDNKDCKATMLSLQKLN